MYFAGHNEVKLNLGGQSWIAYLEAQHASAFSRSTKRSEVPVGARNEPYPWDNGVFLEYQSNLHETSEYLGLSIASEVMVDRWVKREVRVPGAVPFAARISDNDGAV
jgi:hypothetical protein